MDTLIMGSTVLCAKGILPSAIDRPGQQGALPANDIELFSLRSRQIYQSTWKWMLIFLTLFFVRPLAPYTRSTPYTVGCALAILVPALGSLTP